MEQRTRLSSTPFSPNMLYWSRPVKGLRRAFNLISGDILSGKNHVLAVISSSSYAVELMKRSPYPIYFAGSGVFDANMFVNYFQDWAWGEICPIDHWSPVNEQFGVIVWAEPKLNQLEETIQNIGKYISKNTVLYAITPPLKLWSRPGFLSIINPDEGNFRLSKFNRVINNIDFEIDVVYSLNNSRTRLLEFLSDVFIRFDRKAWSDRCLMAVSHRLHPSERLWLSTGQVLIRARLRKF